jgi:hypothetical protein
VTYPFRQARYVYGTRKGTLGLCLHMSEGGDELVDYLAGDPARGVSSNFALLTTGVTWRMTGYDIASGSLNPDDRSSDKGYYGHSTLVDVLGDHWTDPNTWCISIEIAGHAAVGPNDKQIAALGDWAADMRARFPTLRGAFGHADQTDTKGCPGTTAAMKTAFVAVGGHGPWEVDVSEQVIEFSAPIAFTADDPANGAASWAADPPHEPLSRVMGNLQVDATVYIPDGIPHGRFVRIITGVTGRRIASVGSVTPTPAAPADCVQAIADGKAAQQEADRAAAIAAIEAAL